VQSSYNLIARYYDQLSRLVFGNTLVKAQLWLLDVIAPGARVLIAGGGTGWILEAIAAKKWGLMITYVDSSAEMIRLSRQREVGNNQVNFIAGKAEELPREQAFDVVITPFLFDNFSAAGARELFATLDNMLLPDGTWLYCDYRNTNVLWQRLLLKSMYLFFAVVARVAAFSMPDMPALFAAGGYTMEEERLFLRGFISSAIYRKPGAH